MFNLTEGISEEIALLWNECGMTAVSLYEYVVSQIDLYS